MAIEIIKRIRYGYYPKQKQNATIFVRSARLDDPIIRNTCKTIGADYMHLPGKKDANIIQYFKDINLK